MRVLILYTELAGYVLGNINLFLKLNGDAQLLLVHYPVNPEAPFNIGNLPRTELIEFSINSQDKVQKAVTDFRPDIVLCSGWGNKFYLKLIDLLPVKTKRVVCFDNKWKSSFKQRILVLISNFFILKRFTYAWVPGQPQSDYALRLGFQAKNIFTGLYPADSEFFLSIGSKKIQDQSPYPRVMLSVARYIVQKDLPTLWTAFIDANRKTGNNWILKCIGLGDQFGNRTENEFIEHLGFKQPSEMEKYILESGVYVLPSIDEPWGVAVHEMALSALPLVLSQNVGAGSMFLNTNNGFIFPAGDKLALEKILIDVMGMSDDKLYQMSKSSFESGKQLLSEDWSKTLIKILTA